VSLSPWPPLLCIADRAARVSISRRRLPLSLAACSPSSSGKPPRAGPRAPPRPSLRLSASSASAPAHRHGQPRPTKSSSTSPARAKARAKKSATESLAPTSSTAAAANASAERSLAFAGLPSALLARRPRRHRWRAPPQVLRHGRGGGNLLLGPGDSDAHVLFLSILLRALSLPNKPKESPRNLSLCSLSRIDLNQSPFLIVVAI
jgi:hypothetical protein